MPLLRLLVPAVILFAGLTPFRAAEPTFNRDIRPILSENCFACHGYDAKKRKSELRLDTAEGAYGKAESGAVAIKPGDLPGSELSARINATDKDDVMPPPKSHKKLSAAEKELLGRWIGAGAAYQKHWAFVPPVRPRNFEIFHQPKTPPCVPSHPGLTRRSHPADFIPHPKHLHETHLRDPDHPADRRAAPGCCGEDQCPFHHRG